MKEEFLKNFKQKISGVADYKKLFESCLSPQKYQAHTNTTTTKKTVKFEWIYGEHASQDESIVVHVTGCTSQSLDSNLANSQAKYPYIFCVNFQILIAFQAVVRTSEWLWWIFFWYDDAREANLVAGGFGSLKINDLKTVQIQIQNTFIEIQKSLWISQSDLLPLLEHWKCSLENPFWIMNIFKSDFSYTTIMESFKNDILLFLIDKPCHNINSLYLWNDWFSLEMISKFDDLNDIIEYESQSIQCDTSKNIKKDFHERYETKIKSTIAEIVESLLLPIDVSVKKIQYSFPDLGNTVSNRNHFFLFEPSYPVELYYFKPKRTLLHDVNWFDHSITETKKMAILLQMYSSIILPTARFFLYYLQNVVVNKIKNEEFEKMLFDGKVIRKITHPFESDVFKTEEDKALFKNYITLFANLKKKLNDTAESKKDPKLKTIAKMIDIFFIDEKFKT